MKLLALLAAVLLLPQEKNEAEALFKKMEEKIAKAKTVQAKSSGGAETAQGEMTASTVIWWEVDNRVRLEGDTKIPELGKIGVAYISDGKNANWRAHDEDKTGKAPAKLTSDLAGSWARGGGFFTIMWIEAATFKVENHPNRGRVPPCKDFTMGPKEKVGDRDAQKIEYLMTAESRDVSMAVWIDPETYLPVKREMRGLHGREKVTYVETYSDVKLDEKIDPAKFDLPASKK